MSFTPQELQAGFLIGECLIEPLKNRILRGDTEVHVEPRVMDVLVCLAEHAGDVVSRDTLNQRVWTNLVVTDQAVTNCISELRQHLGDDRATHRVIETIPKRGYRLAVPVRFPQPENARIEPAPAVKAPPARRHWLIATGVLLAAVLSAFALWRSLNSSPTPTSVAVLRFENAAGDASLDYLGFALPDEIATLLTTARGLAVRPLGYVDAEDPLAAARERHVDHIVSGRFYREDDAQLSLAIEAQHVGDERVVWRTRISAPADDLLAMRGHIAESVRQGLLPALGGSAGPTGTIPANDEAYQLYLRSVALPQQPKQNERAIELLEQAVALEPTFAPAWHALGLRYYDYGTWWGGTVPARRRSLAAHRKALELDPNLLSAARSIVTHRTESGDLEGAYHEARRVLEHFGPRAEAYFTISYVHRYGGLYEEAQRYCELARERDPQSPRLRSCAYAYLYAGELSRVMEYLVLDEGSYFVHWGTALYHLRRDDGAAALRVVRQAADEPTRRLMEPCLEGVRGDALDAPVAEFVRLWEGAEDPETAYALAPLLLFCGRSQDALRFLQRAADGGVCLYPGFDLDPIWTSVRNDPDFQRLRVNGMACHERYRRIVEAYDKQASNR
jgi:DNA-binding winged helix-turn-helix (wHTH) protein/tetratricopeptide (TPR) repeat protein/TolB-like protein